jgi:hypothetical protein
MNSLRGLHWPLALLGLLLFGSAEGAQITLKTVAETGIVERFPTNNLGAVGYFPSGTIQNFECGSSNIACRARGLIYFDLASNAGAIGYDQHDVIPVGSRIKQASFRIWMTRSPPNDTTDPNRDFDLHRLLVPWGEGTKTNFTADPSQSPFGLGLPATDGEATWTHRAWGTTNTWAIPGGAEGVDYAPEISASGFITDSPGQSPFLFFSTNGLILQDLQFWLENPGSNHGWLVKLRDETCTGCWWGAKRFMTPEAGIDDYPRIEIEYIPPPVIENVQVTSNQVKFQFLAQGGQPYQVQYQDPVGASPWLTLTNVAAPSFTMPIVVTDLVSGQPTQRFYRVVAPP